MEACRPCRSAQAGLHPEPASLVLALPFHPCHANHPPPTFRTSPSAPSSASPPLPGPFFVTNPYLSIHHPSYRYLARPPALHLTYTPTHLTSLHLTYTPGDRACVVAVRSFPLLVVLLRRRIHTPVRCLCSALCEFEPPRYPGTHPPSAPALRSLAACADTISLPPPDNTLPSVYLHDLKPSCPAFSAIRFQLRASIRLAFFQPCTTDTRVYPRELDRTYEQASHEHPEPRVTHPLSRSHFDLCRLLQAISLRPWPRSRCLDGRVTADKPAASLISCLATSL